MLPNRWTLLGKATRLTIADPEEHGRFGAACA